MVNAARYDQRERFGYQLLLGAHPRSSLVTLCIVRGLTELLVRYAHSMRYKICMMDSLYINVTLHSFKIIMVRSSRLRIQPHMARLDFRHVPVHQDYNKQTNGTSSQFAERIGRMYDLQAIYL